MNLALYKMCLLNSIVDRKKNVLLGRHVDKDRALIF